MLKLAFDDVKKKSITIAENKQLFVGTLNKSPDLSIQEIVCEEIKMDVYKCNGNNNAKVLKNS